MKQEPKIRLLKSSRQKNGYLFHNLYLQIDDGTPVAIRLSFETRKLKNYLLACAMDCEIRTKTIVAVKDEPRQADDE